MMHYLSTNCVVIRIHHENHEQIATFLIFVSEDRLLFVGRRISWKNLLKAPLHANLTYNVVTLLCGSLLVSQITASKHSHC